MVPRVCFIDVDTQKDHLDPDGKRYVQQADQILPNLKKLTDFSIEHHIPVISSVCAFPDDFPFENGIDPHCIAGSSGAEKVSETMSSDFVIMPNEACSQTIHFETQIILPKPDLDIFSHAASKTILEAMPTRKCIVYGVTTELAIKSTVNRLRFFGYDIEVIRDAIAPFDKELEENALLEISQLGARFTKTEKVFGQLNPN